MKSGKVGRVRCIALGELRLVSREPSMVIAYSVMPVALIAVVNQAFGVAVTQYTDVDVPYSLGTSVSVGGIAGVFSIILLANFGLFFYRDHSTGVWDRTRATFASPAEIMGGKLTATWFIHLV